MQALAFWKTIIMDKANFLETVVELLQKNGVRFCVIGGQAVNAYVEPLVSLDLDLAVDGGQIARIETLLRETYQVKRFPHSLNVTAGGSDLRVQIQTDPRYAAFVERAAPRAVLDFMLPVARVEDVLQGKIWALQDAARRPSKRQKDLADLARLLEAFPELCAQVPAEIRSRLIS